MHEELGEEQSVHYYLGCHGLELALKGFLRAKRMSIGKLRRDIGHNLRCLLCEAERHGLAECYALTEKDREALNVMADEYESKELEYLTVGYKTRPAFDDLDGLLKKLLDATRRICLGSRKANDHDGA